MFGAQGYDGLHILAAALRSASAPGDRQAVRTALASLKDVPVVVGSTGSFSFTAQREANLTPTVQVVLHGRFQRFT